jgi:hypothetical protein
MLVYVDGNIILKWIFTKRDADYSLCLSASGYRPVATLVKTNGFSGYIKAKGYWQLSDY